MRYSNTAALRSPASASDPARARNAPAFSVATAVRSPRLSSLNHFVEFGFGGFRQMPAQRTKGSEAKHSPTRQKNQADEKQSHQRRPSGLIVCPEAAGAVGGHQWATPITANVRTKHPKNSRKAVAPTRHTGIPPLLFTSMKQENGKLLAWSSPIKRSNPKRSRNKPRAESAWSVQQNRPAADKDAEYSSGVRPARRAAAPNCGNGEDHDYCEVRQRIPLRHRYGAAENAATVLRRIRPRPKRRNPSVELGLQDAMPPDPTVH